MSRPLVDLAAAQEDPTSIGNILLELGLISRLQLSEALRWQEEHLLGKILVEHRMITQESLDMALLKQRLARGNMTAKEKRVEATRLLNQTLEAAGAMRRSFESVTLSGYAAAERLARR